MKQVVLIAVFALATVYMQWQDVRLGNQQQQVAKEIDIIHANNAQQRLKINQLKIALNDMRDNPDAAFEELAREKLFMIKQGEIYILPASEAN